MRHCLTIIVFISSYAALIAQEIPDLSNTASESGLRYDDSAYAKIPQKYWYGGVVETRRLPPKIDLSDYAPSVMNQGDLGTCVGFSAGYYARTILEAVRLGIKDRARIDSLSFSPSFLYNAIKDSNDSSCVNGSLINDALTYMKKNGVARLADVPYSYCDSVSPKLAPSDSRIMDFIRLFGLLDSRNAVTATKKALSEMTPVIIGIQTTKSLNHISFWGKIWRWIMRLFGRTDDSGLWKPTDSNSRGSGHAVCVVGYDDDRYGGAFKMVNSWGPSWGEDGYFWVKYPDFVEFTKHGYQAYLPISPDSAGVIMQGGISIESAAFVTENELPCVRNLAGKGNARGENEESMVAYSLRDPQPTGSSFKFRANVDREAFVYLLGGSSTETSTNVLFPFSATISPHIGPNSKLLLPSEDFLYTLIDDPGEEYLLFLFSTDTLDIERYAFNMSENDSVSSFSSRALSAFGSDLVPYQQVEYDSRKVRFTLRGQHEGHIVPLLISLKQR